VFRVRLPVFGQTAEMQTKLTKTDKTKPTEYFSNERSQKVLDLNKMLRIQ